MLFHQRYGVIVYAPRRPFEDNFIKDAPQQYRAFQ